MKTLIITSTPRGSAKQIANELNGQVSRVAKGFAVTLENGNQFIFRKPTH